MSLFGSIGSFFGISGDNAFNAILGGLGAASEGRAAREAARIRAEGDLRTTRLSGIEQRRNMEYEALLAKWLKDKEKEERRIGLSNWARFSAQNYGPNPNPPPAVGDRPSTIDYERQFGDPNKPLDVPSNSGIGTAFSRAGRGLRSGGG